MRTDMQDLRADMHEMVGRLSTEIREAASRLRSDVQDMAENLRTEINRSEARMHDHMDTNTNTVLSHLRLDMAIMVPVSLGVLTLLAKVIFYGG